MPVNEACEKHFNPVSISSTLRVSLQAFEYFSTLRVVNPSSLCLTLHVSLQGEQDLGSSHNSPLLSQTARTPGRSQESDDTSGQIYALRATGGTVLVVVAQDGVQPERAVAWTRALFGGISAARYALISKRSVVCRSGWCCVTRSHCNPGVMVCRDRSFREAGFLKRDRPSHQTEL
jgi:hypothetical protein